MSGLRRIKWIIVVILLLVAGSNGQPIPLEVKLGISRQGIIDDKVNADLADHSFFVNGLNLNFRYDLGDRFQVGFYVGYDYMNIDQFGVLNEWDWDYWEDTYIDFIPGADVAVVNRTLRYESGDSVFAAVFEPEQQLKELHLAFSFHYKLPLTQKLTANFSLQTGATLFTRDLQMTEHWTKRFLLDSASTERFDYEYQYDLVHFAPPKEGTRLFVAPVMAFNYQLAEGTHVEFAYRHVQYLLRKQIDALEKFLGIPASNEKWFPLHSKFQFQLGIVIHY